MSKSGQSSITALSAKHSKRLKKSSLANSNNVFKEALYEACKEMNMDVIPTVRTFSTERPPWILQESSSNLDVSSKLSMVTTSKKTSKQAMDSLQVSDTEVLPKVSQSQEIQVIYPTNRSGIGTLIAKHFQMTNHILGALQKTVLKFQTLKSLKLEFCQLTLEQLKAVKYLLVQNPYIIDLSLNGNDVAKQPYHILIKNTNIVALSLKYCKISEKGTVKLKKPLGNVSFQYLSILNLASNMIGNTGVIHLAEALRLNRTLTHLNLADNQISDTGVTDLMKVLRKFPLHHDEIVLKRQKNLHYLLLKEEIKYDLAKGKKSESSVSFSKSEVSSKRSCSSARMRMARGFDKLSNSSLATSQRRRNSADSYRSINSFIESKLPKDSYPYMYECTAEDKEIYCRGNFHLQYLNLSYNKITDVGLCTVKDTFIEQQLTKVLDSTDSGLLKVNLEGNNIKNPDILSDSSFTSPNESKTSSRASMKERKGLSSKIVV